MSDREIVDVIVSKLRAHNRPLATIELFREVSHLFSESDARRAIISLAAENRIELTDELDIQIAEPQQVGSAE